MELEEVVGDNEAIFRLERFDNFSSSENVFNPHCLNSFEPQKIFHFPRISLFVFCFMLSVFFDLNQHHLKNPWLEKNRQLCQPS